VLDQLIKIRIGEPAPDLLGAVANLDVAQFASANETLQRLV
jgi:hypothetical protein